MLSCWCVRCRAYAAWQGAARKGEERAWVQCKVIHEVWTQVGDWLSCSLVGSTCLSQALLNHVHLWIKRVPSVENIADLPSREEYELLGRLHAEWIEPRVAQLFMD